MLQRIITNKNYQFLAMGIFLLYLSYALAFKLTIEAFTKNQDLKEKGKENSDIRFNPEFELRKSNNLDLVLKRFRLDSTDFRNKTLSQISYLADQGNVKLSEVPNLDPQWSTKNYFAERLDFEGDYYHLLGFLDALESANLGYPRSIAFISKRKTLGPTQENKLILRIYFEIAK